MADQTLTDVSLTTNLEQEFGEVELPENVIEDTTMNREFMRELIDANLEAFIHKIRNKILIFGGVNIIPPFDGSTIALYEFNKKLGQYLTEEEISKIHMVYAAKSYNPNGSYKYILSSQPDESFPALILDDIFDSGSSSAMIKKVSKRYDIQVVSLATKQGTGFYQGSIPMYTYLNKWIMSGLGMNSGQFGERELKELFLSGLIDEDLLEILLPIHQRIEIYERMCARSFYIDDGSLTDPLPWRLDPVKCMEYYKILKLNCFYEGDEEKHVYKILKKLQRVPAPGKFKYAQG